MSTFHAATIYQDKTAKLTAVAAYSDDVVIGTQDGHILHLTPTSADGSTPTPTVRHKVEVTAAHAVVQLCAAEPCGVVVVLLSDGTVVIHELPSLKSRGAVERGVDCTSIALLHGEAAESCKLAAAGRKKLVLYRWRAGTTGGDTNLFDAEEGAFEPWTEVALPEPMRWMAWGGEAQLWLALKQRYVKLALPSLKMADVLPYVGGGGPGGGGGGGGGGSSGGGGGGGGGGGKGDKKEREKDLFSSEPLGAPLAHGEALLLAQETLGVFVDAHGKPCRGFNLTLGEPPLGLVASGALFLCSLHKRGVDVHALHAARPPMQRVAHLAGASALAAATSGGASTAASRALRPPPVYVLSRHSVERLLPPTLPAHAIALAAGGALDEALSVSEAHVLPAWRAAGDHDAVLHHLSSIAHASMASSTRSPPPPPLPNSIGRATPSDIGPSAPAAPKHKRSLSEPPAPPPSTEPSGTRGGELAAEVGVGVDRATTVLVAYLRGLNGARGADAAVIHRHAEILLRREPTVAAALLCERLPSGAWLLAPPDAFALLHEAAPSMAVPLLEALLADASDTERPAAVAALVDALLDAAVPAGHTGYTAAGADASRVDAVAVAYAGERLLSLLHETMGTSDLDSHATLVAIEAASAHDAKPLARHRLLLLGALGRHSEAIDLLAGRIDTVDLAESYCAAHSERTAPAAGASAATAGASLFVQLLERYFRPADGAPPNLASANELLARWPSEQTSAIDALRQLPAHLPICELESGLTALLGGTHERQRASQMRAALLRAVSLQTRAELQQKRGRRLVVNDETECVVCGRRIGSAAFAYVASSGAFMHHGCHGVKNVSVS